MAKKITNTQDAHNTLIKYLTRKGERIMWNAYNSREFKNQTFNLHDSYGSAVFYNGKVIKSTIRYLGSEQAKKKNHRTTDWTWKGQRSMPDHREDRHIPDDYLLMSGRDEVMEFFSKYVPKTTGYHVVVVAAMFYANILEKGQGNLKRTYRVITGAKGEVEAFAKSVNGYYEIVHLNRDLSKPHSIKGKGW